VEERWWEPDGGRRRARFQLVDATGQAHLAVVEGGRWWVEALYD
jgi:protein ImuB